MLSNNVLVLQAFKRFRECSSYAHRWITACVPAVQCGRGSSPSWNSSSTWNNLQFHYSRTLINLCGAFWCRLLYNLYYVGQILYPYIEFYKCKTRLDSRCADWLDVGGVEDDAPGGQLVQVGRVHLLVVPSHVIPTCRGPSVSYIECS